MQKNMDDFDWLTVLFLLNIYIYILYILYLYMVVRYI